MKRFLGSALAGLSATLLMEYASSFIYERQSEESCEREEQLRTEMPTTALVRKVAGGLNAELDDDKAQRLGMISHYVSGAAGGPAAVTLMGTGMSPMKAATAVSASMEIFVDQAANTVLGLTAPSWESPVIANVRGVAAHAVYGAALGLILAAGGD